jgi:hypothetical protein
MAAQTAVTTQIRVWDHISIAGVRIRLAFGDPVVRESLLPALSHRLAEDGEPAATVFIDDGPLQPLPEEDATTRVAFFAPSRALSVYDVSQNVGRFAIPSAAALPPYERAAPLRTLMHWVLSSRGCTFAHAAAVGINASGVLLTGPGGSGKSTTALLCAQAGFTYAGDDYVGLTTSDRGVEAHSLFCTAKIDAGSLEMMPFLRELPMIAPRDGEKGVVFLRDVVPSLAIRALIIPRVVGGVSRLRRTNRAEALRALAPTSVFQLPRTSGETFRALADVVRLLPAFALELGDDRDNIPDLVAKAIEESA